MNQVINPRFNTNRKCKDRVYQLGPNTRIKVDKELNPNKNPDQRELIRMCVGSINSKYENSCELYVMNTAGFGIALHARNLF